MKMSSQLDALLSVLFFASALSIFAQGPLNPPGAPAATMKSLDQIEARTPISSLPFNITASGSYYLTKNLSVSTGSAITIAVSGVTLDLNGFTISSTNASPGGSFAVGIGSALHDITTLNGHIGGTGFGYGIISFGTSPANTFISRVSVFGCSIDGINVGASFSTVVESCTVDTVGGSGIVADTVKASSAFACSAVAITANQVSDCWGQSLTSDGIYCTVAQNCFGNTTSANGGYGIYAFSAQNCYGAAPNVTTTGSAGIYASVAQNCYGTSSTTGLLAVNAQNCDGVGTGGSSLGLEASIAIACTGSGSIPIIAGHQYFCGSGPATYP